MSGRPDDIVGHATHADGSHSPITRALADALMAEADAAKAARAEQMPDSESAIRILADAHQRLRELGWNDPIYCPKDGTPFEVIEAGSTGIHRAIYMGDWPKGSWWVQANGDLWPSRPTLFRPLTEDNGQPA